jgi:hypothetical protein
MCCMTPSAFDLTENLFGSEALGAVIKTESTVRSKPSFVSLPNWDDDDAFQGDDG